MTLSVRVLNGTIGEGSTIQVRLTTADYSAYGREQLTVQYAIKSSFFVVVVAAPLDYSPISEVLTFSSFSTARTARILIVNDSLLEIDEVFTASLSLDDPADLGYVQLGPTSTFITIIDDDGNEHAVVGN